jgi:hypothetical protein
MGYKYAEKKRIERVQFTIGGDNIEYYENIHEGFNEIMLPHRRDFDIINMVIKPRIIIRPIGGYHIYILHGAETLSRRALTCIKGMMEKYYSTSIIILLSRYRERTGIAMNLPAPVLDKSRIDDIIIRCVADYTLSQVILDANIIKRIGDNLSILLLRADHICDQYRAGNSKITLKYPDPIDECWEQSDIREIITDLHKLGISHREMIALAYKRARIDIKPRIIGLIAEYDGLLHNAENLDYIVEFISTYIINIGSIE